MLVVEELGLACGGEKLAAVRIRASVGHGELVLGVKDQGLNEFILEWESWQRNFARSITIDGSTLLDKSIGIGKATCDPVEDFTGVEICADKLLDLGRCDRRELVKQLISHCLIRDLRVARSTRIVGDVEGEELPHYHAGSDAGIGRGDRVGLRISPAHQSDWHACICWNGDVRQRSNRCWNFAKFERLQIDTAPKGRLAPTITSSTFGQTQ